MIDGHRLDGLLRRIVEEERAILLPLEEMGRGPELVGDRPLRRRPADVSDRSPLGSLALLDIPFMRALPRMHARQPGVGNAVDPEKDDVPWGGVRIRWGVVVVQGVGGRAGRGRLMA